MSLFIAADPRQIEAAAAIGAPVIEIHTGAWCDALARRDTADAAEAELERIRDGAGSPTRRASKSMPATGSTTRRPKRSRRCANVVELNIGHFLVGEALSVGLARGGADHARRDGPRAARERHELAMIIGIGSDLVDIRRIERTIERHGERFLNRIFTETERARAERRADRVETYAKRFAAKEACAKALGTGLRRGVFWRDMGVVNLPSGRPTMKLTGGALRAAAGDHAGRLPKPGSTSPSPTKGPMAQAFVVISAVPEEESLTVSVTAS